MGALKRISTPELKGFYANSNRFTQPQGTVPRVSNYYMVRRGAFHTIPGSKWVSSWDGLAPHVTNQLPLQFFQWYSPSAGSSPDLFMAAYNSITAHNFLLALQQTSTGVALLDVSGATFQSLATQPIPTPSNPHPGVVLVGADADQFGDYLVVGLGNSVPPNIFPTYTQVEIAIGTTDTSVQVMSTTPFPSSGFIVIGTETIQYTGITPTSFTGLTRGALGTVAASHAIGAGVFRAASTTATTLQFGILSGNPAAQVFSTAGFPTSGYILIDSELIAYAAKVPAGFTGLTRGQGGTTATSHSAGAFVILATAPPFNNQAVWGPITNTFDPSTVYSQWPGTPNSSAASAQVGVNIGTLIYEVDGNGIAWLFRAQNSGVTAYGATYAGPTFFPNSLHGTDGSIASGSPTLTSAAGKFTPAMVGETITVDGAGAAGADLMTTILAFVSATQVTLATNASTTVTTVVFDVVGVGHYGDVAKDYNPANKSGTVIWLNVGQATLSPPGAAFVFQHLDFLFLWGVGSVYGNDGITGPDALWQSDFQIPMSFNSANITFVGKGDGTTAQGGAVYSLSEAGIAATPQLVLFKDASTYSFLNSFPVAALVAVSGGLGCIAPNTIQFIGSLGVMRLSYAGVTLFDGQLEHVTEYTDAIRGYLFGGLPDVTPVDFANINKCVSTQSINPPMYIFFAPLAGGTGFATRGFGYDFGLKQWFVIDLPWAIGAAAFLPQAVSAVAAGYQSIVGGSNDGSVRRMFAGDPDWDGTPINGSMRMPDFGYPGTPVYIRRLNVRITADGGGAAPAITAATFAGVRRSGASFSRTLNTPPSILGSLDVGETVLSGAVTISTRGQVLIEGSDAQTSDKPMARIGGTGQVIPISGAIGASTPAGAAPFNATYITQANEASRLPNSRQIEAGANIGLTDGGPGNQETITGTGAPAPLIFRCDATTGTFTQNLPAALVVGQLAVIKKTDATANGVVAHPFGTDTIDGVNGNTTPITLQNDALRLIVAAAGAWAII